MFITPNGHYTEWPLQRMVIIPNGHCAEIPLHRIVIIPKVNLACPITPNGHYTEFRLNGTEIRLNGTDIRHNGSWEKPTFPCSICILLHSWGDECLFQKCFFVKYRKIITIKKSCSLNSDIYFEHVCAEMSIYISVASPGQEQDISTFL